MSDRKFRIMYGRVDGNIPKNTLATVIDDDTVYFGISRCNTKTGDCFHKTKGVKIAQNRCEVALNESGGDYQPFEESNVSVHHSGLRGSVKIDNVSDLISVFKGIDEILYKRGINKTVTQAAEVG